MPARRFPPPWTVEKLNACFVVRYHRAGARVTDKPSLFHDCLMTLFVWNRTSNNKQKNKQMPFLLIEVLCSPTE
jgi:hypothetical protein